MSLVNIYCDESCHLQKDKSDIMVLGGVCCQIQDSKKLNEEIRIIKEKHGIKRDAELKWTKISNSKIDLYKEIIDLFFNNNGLSFRGIIATGKQSLDHQAFLQDHDTWYYKMYFYLLREMIRIGDTYRVYMDIKDTNSAEKVEFLRKVLNKSLGDFFDETVERIQMVRSEEVELLQITDILIGALAYANRNFDTSNSKIEMVRYIESKSGFNLTKKTSRSTQKFNIFIWEPRR